MRRFSFSIDGCGFFVLIALSIFIQNAVANPWHVIDGGNLYRSKQPTVEELEWVHKTSGLGTIINLRGQQTDAQWYRDERAFAERTNVQMIDIPMSADSLPHRENLIQLLDAFKTAPRPILIHCRAGVDRTGEAAAIYQMLYMGKSKRRAMRMLSPIYGYFRPLKPAKAYLIDIWQGEEWARNEYDPCNGAFPRKFYDTSDKRCARTARSELTDHVESTP